METNARRKDVTAAKVTVALAFPDAYTIGICHLGHHMLYHTLNDLPGVACDRTYCPLADAEEVMREQSVPLFGWESRCAIADFDVVGFSLTYELCATNVLTMLDLAGIPLLGVKLRAALAGMETMLKKTGFYERKPKEWDKYWNQYKNDIQ